MSQANIIDGLCKAIESNRQAIMECMVGVLNNSKIKVKNADNFLNFKFNLLRSIINESTIDGLKDYKGCLDNNDVSYKQKIEKTNLINNMNQYVSERFSLHLMLQWTILILVV